MLICLDTECIIILVNRAYLKEQNADYVSFKISLILVCDVRQANSFTEVVIFHLNFEAQLNSKFMITKMKIEAHIIDNLRINLFLEINNLVSQEVVIDLIKQQAVISACSNIIVKINISAKSSHQLIHSVYINVKMIILSHSEIHILIRIYKIFKLSENQDYIFKLKSDLLIFYIHVMNVLLSFTHIINIIKKSVIIS